MNLETNWGSAAASRIYDSRNFNELGNNMRQTRTAPIYDSRNFNELGNAEVNKKGAKSTTVEISMNLETKRATNHA